MAVAPAFFDLDRFVLEPLLFQTGYLTVHEFDGARYRLGYPNQEVKTAFLKTLLLGINFSTSARRIADWQVEVMRPF